MMLILQTFTYSKSHPNQMKELNMYHKPYDSYNGCYMVLWFFYGNE
jgi:hypothetical protein